MRLTHVLTVGEVVLERDDDEITIYASDWGVFQFVLIIPIIGNVIALAWWLHSTFGDSYYSNRRGSKVVYSSMKGSKR